MRSLFADSRFLDFGPSAFLAPGGACRCACVEGHKPAALRGQVKLLAPRRPGVYGMIDCDEQLIYVGKAKNLRVRLLSYFRKKGRRAKAGRMIGLARRIVWEVLPSEFAGLLRELELIRRWRPRFNVQGQPLRRRLTFICLGQAPAPYLFLSGKISAKVQCAFGPLGAGKRVQEAVRRLNDWFRLRDCPEPIQMIFPDQKGLFTTMRDPGCLRMEIGMCLGPCTGRCERGAYQKQAERARAFLAGSDLSCLQALEAEMLAAGQEQQFERAAALRDRWQIVQWLADRLARLRKAQEEMSFIYPIHGFDGSAMWYLIHGARAIGAIEAPTDEASKKAAADKIAALYRGRAGLLDSYEHADGMMVVMQWFRKHPDERKRCWTPDDTPAASRAP